MKKLQKPRTKKARLTRRTLLIGSLLFIVLFAVTYYRAKILSPATINVVSTPIYGPTQIEGRLYKETPSGIPGVYYLVSSSAEVVELELADNIDNLLGQPVIATGDLVPPDEASGKPILIVSSIIVKP